MELRDVIASRRSVRAYRPDPVEEEKLSAVLEAGLLAPTARVARRDAKKDRR